jgi:hypothetical protein
MRSSVARLAPVELRGFADSSRDEGACVERGLPWCFVPSGWRGQDMSQKIRAGRTFQYRRASPRPCPRRRSRRRRRSAHPTRLAESSTSMPPPEPRSSAVSSAPSSATAAQDGAGPTARGAALGGDTLSNRTAARGQLLHGIGDHVVVGPKPLSLGRAPARRCRPCPCFRSTPGHLLFTSYCLTRMPTRSSAGSPPAARAAGRPARSPARRPGHGFKRFSRDRDRLGSVGHLAPFLAPADSACFDI